MRIPYPAAQLFFIDILIQLYTAKLFPEQIGILADSGIQISDQNSA